MQHLYEQYPFAVWSLAASGGFVLVCAMAFAVLVNARQKR